METNNNNTVITVTEKTAEMYFLHKELSDLLEKVSNWNEKYNGVQADEKVNALLQEKFYDKAYEAFSPFEQFLHNLLKGSIVENVYKYNNTL